MGYSVELFQNNEKVSSSFLFDNNVKDFDLVDIVDVDMFLRGCMEPLDQYRECLMMNVKDWSGRSETVAGSGNTRSNSFDEWSPDILEARALPLQGFFRSFLLWHLWKNVMIVPIMYDVQHQVRLYHCREPGDTAFLSPFTSTADVRSASCITCYFKYFACLHFK